MYSGGVGGSNCFVIVHNVPEVMLLNAEAFYKIISYIGILLQSGFQNFSP